MMMPSAPLQATTPGLLDLVYDGHAMRLWELIRMQATPVSVASLVGVTAISEARIQGYLDALTVQGLLRKVRARTPRKWVGYRVTRDRIVIGFDRGSPAIEQQLRELSLRTRDQWESTTREFADEDPHRSGVWRFNFLGFDQLTPEESAELRRRVLAVCEFWNLLGSRAIPENAEKGQILTRPCNHALQIRVQPLRDGLLALPEIWMIPNSELEREASAKKRIRGLDQLSPREHEVARAIALGRSRKHVASQLGISVNTVGTLTKRVFAKLGVRKSSELAARLATAASRP